MFTWYRFHPDGYEVSSKGDKRFSAFYAKLDSGHTIEFVYQTQIKGYNSISQGKGNPPLFPISNHDLYLKYKALWQQWASLNPLLISQLKLLAKSQILTDAFASTNINQARALADILNDIYNPINKYL